MKEMQEGPSAARQFQTVVAKAPPDNNTDFWRKVRADIHPPTPSVLLPPDAASLESGLMPIATLNEAPPRTLQCGPVMRSSPMPHSLRSMLERREFGRPCDATQVD